MAVVVVWGGVGHTPTPSRFRATFRVGGGGLGGQLEGGGGGLPLPMGRCVQAVIPNRWCGTPPQRRLLGPGMSTCGVYSPPGAHNNLLTVVSRAQSSLWRAQPPYPPPPVSLVCALSLRSHVWHAWVWSVVGGVVHN